MNPQYAIFAIAFRNLFSLSCSLLQNFYRVDFFRVNVKRMLLASFTLFFCFEIIAQNQNTILDETSDYHVNPQTLGRAPVGGDTIFVKSSRTFPLRFQNIEGDSLNPIVVINKGGQVKIDGISSNTWGAITFENCKYIKISGTGHPGYKYGFELSAMQCGLGFIELSSDCEAENIKISHEGFFGIYAKKDYGGNPPFPYPVFKNLLIHDCFIEGVSEGMYLGETKTPGMEFKHVRIYNNIIRDTQRESIQIANMVEDVEIYNNTMLDPGSEGAIYHMNNLQIGANTVVNAYNNIMIGAPIWGAIIMGKGDCFFTNNYIESTQGIFIDNRILGDTLTPIDIKANYFRSTTGNQIIRNMNELNYFTAENNKYDTNISFYLDQTGVDNDTLINNTLTTVAQIQFTDPSTNDYTLVSSTPSEYLNMGAPSGPEFFEYDDPATTPRQLIITPEMVIDSVQGGSVNAPLLLFDEQSLDIEANEHATSLSWKPDYMMNESSYHAMVDLGDEHQITKLVLHDMHSTHNFTVEYYDGAVWNSLFVEPCDAFNVWKTHEADIITRYLRFSMYDDVFASVNEIFIYGYPLTKESEQIVVNASMVTDQVIGGSVFPPTNLFDQQTVNVHANEHPTGEAWKPYFNGDNAPYYAMVDLGQDHHISKVYMHDINSTYDFIVEYNDNGTWTQLFVEPCDAYNVWKTHLTDVVTRYLRFVMPSSPYARVNEMILEGYPIMTIGGVEPEPEPEPEPESSDEQIIITSSMVTDWVTGGSVNSPDLLFNQQNVSVGTNEHATGDSWKPFFTNVNAPYYATIDLGQDYHVSKVILHDMNSTYDFNIEYAVGENWVNLLVEPCDKFNVWKTHEKDISTRYLRLTMLESPYAAINEILFYGYPVSNSSKQNKGKVPMPAVEVKASSFNRIEIISNQLNELSIVFPEIMVGENQITIIDERGRIVYNTQVNVSRGMTKIDLKNTSYLVNSGFYVLSSRNESGEHQTVKFFKD